MEETESKTTKEPRGREDTLGSGDDDSVKLC